MLAIAAAILLAAISPSEESVSMSELESSEIELAFDGEEIDFQGEDIVLDDSLLNDMDSDLPDFED